jgi:hypothetical protein
LLVESSNYNYTVVSCMCKRITFVCCCSVSWLDRKPHFATLGIEGTRCINSILALCYDISSKLKNKKTEAENVYTYICWHLLSITWPWTHWTRFQVWKLSTLSKLILLTAFYSWNLKLFTVSEGGTALCYLTCR